MQTDIALFILRVFTGLTILYHGWGKLTNFKGTIDWLASEKYPFPALSAFAITTTETLGAVFLMLGIYVPIVALIILFAMLVAMFQHVRKGQGWKMQAEVPATFAIIMLVLIIGGGGAWQLLG